MDFKAKARGIGQGGGVYTKNEDHRNPPNPPVIWAPVPPHRFWDMSAGARGSAACGHHAPHYASEEKEAR